MYSSFDMSLKINPDESKIIGNWIFDGVKMIADDQCKRIELLRSEYLKLISTDSSGWNKLYIDPNDGRYWELQFKNGEMQGGGPPSLIIISEIEAKSKFNI